MFDFWQWRDCRDCVCVGSACVGVVLTGLHRRLVSPTAGMFLDPYTHFWRSIVPFPLFHSQSQMPKTILIPIPISKSTPPRFRNSIEGLNQEIERIIIRDTVEREEIIVVSASQQLFSFSNYGVRKQRHFLVKWPKYINFSLCYCGWVPYTIIMVNNYDACG